MLIQRIASLDTTGQELRSQTGRLVDALKRPGVRGRWGELQLKRVIELAGMVEHCDFYEQTTITSSDMAGILMSAVQALEKHRAEQSQHIDALTAENAELKARLERLERTLPGYAMK